MITCTRKLWFSAGHRVYGHESKCANLHGHNYMVWLTARAPKGLDSVGRVIDGGVLKAVFDPWIQHYWDHGTILFKDDPLVLEFQSREQLIGHKRYIMLTNPTAENMAEHLLALGPELLKGTNAELIEVCLYETQNFYATATL